MTNQTIPPWGDDALSQFLSSAQENERISSLNMPELYELLQHVNAIFQDVMDITEKDHSDALLPARMLMARARGSWLAAVRLGMSGLTVETYPLVRSVIENAWYALHIAKDPANDAAVATPPVTDENPAPPTRAEIWLNRRQDKAATDLCREEFKVGNVRRTHEGLDSRNAAAMRDLYDRTIEMGGHPNELGVLGSLTRTETADALTFDVAFLTNNPLLISLAIKSAIEAGVGALRVFRLIFPERFDITGLRLKIEKLAVEHNAIFAYLKTQQATKRSAPS